MFICSNTYLYSKIFIYKKEKTFKIDAFILNALFGNNLENDFLILFFFFKKAFKWKFLKRTMNN